MEKWRVKMTPAWGKMQNVVNESSRPVAFFQTEEDARLGACAPELLKALEDILDKTAGTEEEGVCPVCRCSKSCEDWCWYERARVVVAKAKGEGY